MNECLDMVIRLGSSMGGQRFATSSWILQMLKCILFKNCVLIHIGTDITHLQVSRLHTEGTVVLTTIPAAVLAVSKYELIWK
jgi:hypothetical protein